MKLLYIIFFSLFGAGFVQPNFIVDAWRQYQAYNAYDVGNYEQAGIVYTKLLQNDPYDAQVNYNMGLVFYKQKKHEMASHYFDRAVGHSKNSSLLKEQALFNLGNAYVEQKKLYEAMGSYSKVLELNSKNDKARHNLEYVKQLLQEQQKDQQDKNNQSQNDSKNQQNSDTNQQQDSSKSNSKKSQTDSSKNQKDQKPDQQQPDGSGQEHEQNQDSGQQSKDSSPAKNQQGKDDLPSKEDVADNLQKANDRKSLDKDSNGTSKKETPSQGKDQQSSAQDIASKKGDSKDGNPFKDGIEKSKESQSEGGSKGIQQDSQLQDLYASQMEQNPETDERLDKRAVMVMQQMQQQEDRVQKQLLKMNVSKSGAFGYGQKNW